MPENYEKLVRDKIPQILDKEKVPYEKRVASLEEYKTELIKKLGEEIAEFSEAKTPEELADIIEIIDALKRLPEFKNVELVRLKKLAEKGGFKEQIIVKGEKYK